MTVNSRVVKAFLDMSPDAIDVPLMNGLRIQILPSVEFLPRARKHQFAAFIASDGLLVVWDDDPMHLMDRAKSVQDELMELVWKTNNDEGEGDEKNRGTRTGEVEIDEESGQIIPEKRPIHLQNTILVSVTLAIITVSLGAAWRQLSIEVKVDGYFVRLALVALAPVQIFFTVCITKPFPLYSIFILFNCFAYCCTNAISPSVIPITYMLILPSSSFFTVSGNVKMLIPIFA